VKEASWAFTARLFLVVKWDSATDGGVKKFSSTRENTEGMGSRLSRKSCTDCPREPKRSL